MALTLEEQLGEAAPIIKRLYNGNITLTFHPGKHKYMVSEGNDSWEVPSVTTILNIIDKSGPLIAWAVNQCADAAVTEFAKLMLDNPTLSSIKQIEDIMAIAKNAHRRRKDEAADSGALAHSWLQWHSKRRDLTVASKLPVVPSAKACCEAAVEWFKWHHVTPVCAEELLYSRKWDVAGTADLIAFVDGKLSVLDYKSSKACYDQYWLQTAAYVKLWEEEHNERTSHIEQRIVLQLGKEDGKFVPHVRSDRDWLDADFRAFRAAQVLQEHMETLKDYGKEKE